MENTMEAKVWIAVNAKGKAYDGTFKRRVDAKLARVSEVTGKPEESPDGKGMTEKQEAIWDDLAEKGDKVVKATLSWGV